MGNHLQIRNNDRVTGGIRHVEIDRSARHRKRCRNTSLAGAAVAVDGLIDSGDGVSNGTGSVPPVAARIPA